MLCLYINSTCIKNEAPALPQVRGVPPAPPADSKFTVNVDEDAFSASIHGPVVQLPLLAGVHITLYDVLGNGGDILKTLDVAVLAPEL